MYRSDRKTLKNNCKTIRINTVVTVPLLDELERNTLCNFIKRISSNIMPLYLYKNLCDKLGHTITIDSVSGSYTTVTISFGKNHFYDVIDE